MKQGKLSPESARFYAAVRRVLIRLDQADEATAEKIRRAPRGPRGWKAAMSLRKTMEELES
jgi:hypothetical protein